METIIGLLFILLPVIFKLIGKKLEDAGKPTTPSETPASFDVDSWVQEAMDEAEEEVIQPEVQPHPQLRPQPQVAPAPAEEATPSVIDFNEYMRKRSAARKPAKKAPALVEEEQKPKEKIDPKKLVIYSEIMSPKYKE